MKRILFTLILTLVYFYSYSQMSTIKLLWYDGQFNFNEFIGKAHYSYEKDEDGTRAFEGPFSFSGNMSGKLFLNVHGGFKQDLKNGTWTYISTFKQGLITSMKQTLTADYNLGSLTGIIKVSANTAIKDGSKNYAIIISGTAHTQDNAFTGSISYDRKITGVDKQLKPLSLKGQFNDSGYCDGIWTIDYQNDDLRMCEARITFINGVMVAIKDIDLQMGQVIDSYDHPELIEDARQLTGFTDQSTVNGKTTSWKLTTSELWQMVEVQNLFNYSAFHLKPKGFTGNVPYFRTRLLRNY